ncbi:MAG TPA: hypothetical protein VLJ59_17710 [Mycobacteriales bacterium]|nr:hypothetical protein [Mycobacteriales bacterium]
MSMWRMGREAVRIDTPVLTPLDRSVAGGGRGPLGDIVDTVTKWVPGEVLALYGVGVTMIGAPNWFWLVVSLLLAPAVVALSAFANSGILPPDPRIGARALLGFGAMLIWTLTVPESGWREWAPVRDNPTVVALAAAAFGLMFGLVAEGVTRWVDSRPSGEPRPTGAGGPDGPGKAGTADRPDADEPTAALPTQSGIESQSRPMRLPSIPPLD